VQSTDRRIQRTRTLLHEALGSLIREKAYDRIDDLLVSSMPALLFETLTMEGDASRGIAERMASFSLPLFTHIHQHRRPAKTRLGERGWAILHQHLRQVLSEWIEQTMEAGRQQPRSRRSTVPPALLAQRVASTFVLVLHWWLDRGTTTSPAEGNELFRALVMPVLRSAPP
jgi:hypothetical protein